MDKLKTEGAAAPDQHVHHVPHAHSTADDENLIQPCAIGYEGRSMSVHMLTCGHLVTIDDPSGFVDKRCGLNCVHVAEWIKQQTINTPVEEIDLLARTGLGVALASSAPLQQTKDPIVPVESLHQSHHTIFCEICQGLPASSYFILPRDLKRALAFTRPVIEHLTGFTNEEISNRLCRPFHNPSQAGYDLRLSHNLRCGHEVWTRLDRPCAANCSNTAQCKRKILAGNSNSMSDVIFCHECVYRAELVYERYTQVAKHTAAGLESRSESPSIFVPGMSDAASRSYNEPTYGVADYDFSNYHEFPASEELVYGPDLAEQAAFGQGFA